MVEKELKMAVFATKHQRTTYMGQCVLQNSKELCSSVYFKTAKNCVRVRVCYKTASLSSKREQAHRVPNMHAPCPALHYYYALHTNMYALLPLRWYEYSAHRYACSYRSALLCLASALYDVSTVQCCSTEPAHSAQSLTIVHRPSPLSRCK